MRRQSKKLNLLGEVIPSMATRRHSYEYVKQVFEERGCTLLSTEYKNGTQLLDYICSCGNKTTTRFTNFSRGHKCKKCGAKATSKKRRYTLEQVKEIFEKGGCELVSTEYKGSQYPLRYVCNCGRESTTLLGNFQRGARCKHCGYDKLRGENNYQWKTDREETGRNTPEYREWRRKVLERDEHICQKCGETYWSMTAHHIINYSEESKMRYVVDNGVTLCRPCHTEFHTQFGFEGNDGEQLIQFITDSEPIEPWFAGELL